MILPFQFGITCCVSQQNSVFFNIINLSLTNLGSVEMAGYWPHCFFVCVTGLISSHLDLPLGQ